MEFSLYDLNVEHFERIYIWQTYLQFYVRYIHGHKEYFYRVFISRKIKITSHTQTFLLLYMI